MRASTWSTRRRSSTARWGGQADFLLRTDQPSDLGPWSYDIADTKLARRLKVPALLQMATYAERLTVLQGVPPRLLTVVTGDGVERPWRLDDVASYARRARRPAAAGGRDRAPTTEPAPVAALLAVPLVRALHDRWAQADDLSLVAGMRSGPPARADRRGLPTVEALAAAGVTELPRTIGRPSRERLAPAGPAAGAASGPPARPPTSCCRRSRTAGCCGCPQPSDGDVYLDFEGDPFAADGQGREYLAGLWDRSGRFTTWWAHDARPRRRR